MEEVGRGGGRARRQWRYGTEAVAAEKKIGSLPTSERKKAPRT